MMNARAIMLRIVGLLLVTESASSPAGFLRSPIGAHIELSASDADHEDMHQAAVAAGDLAAAVRAALREQPPFAVVDLLVLGPRHLTPP
jgi:hypothetical protein